MGWLEGGYQTLIDALERRIRRARRRDPRRHDGRADRRRTNGAATGLVVDGRFRPFDFVLCTLAPPHGAAACSRPSCCRRRRRRPLPLPRRRLPAPADAPERQPLLPPQHHRPAGAADDDRRDDARRRPRARSAATCSTSPSTSTRPSPLHERPADEIEREFLGHARTIFPDLADEDDPRLGRPARPGHRAGAHSSAARRTCPTCSRSRTLALASTAHVYPEIVSGQAVTGVAERVAAGRSSSGCRRASEGNAA